MPSTGTIPLITVIPGQTITASLWNNEYENIDTLFIPAGMDDYSTTDTEMRTTTDPYPAAATSRPTSLQGELERLRYVVAQLSGETYWYIDPQVDIATFKTRFDAHTHDGTANQGPQIAAAGLASDSVTTAKILDANVTLAKLASLSVDENKLTTSVAGNGLAGGAGTALSVNVDASTIEISSDTLRVKDAGITAAKLATGILSQHTTYVSTFFRGQDVPSFTTILSATGPGALKGVSLKGHRNGGAAGGATFTVRVTIDSVAYSVSGLAVNLTTDNHLLPETWTSGVPPTLANFFTSNTGMGTGSDFYFGYLTGMTVEIICTGGSDQANGVYVTVSYES